jgi:arylamine N-acetyltransferase
MTGVDVGAYLARIGLAESGPPSARELALLHAAHVERVPFETLSRPRGVDPYESLERVLGGAGGVCYHLNGAFWLLLRTLGYDVTLHAAGVQSVFAPRPAGPVGTHNVILASGLSDEDNPGGRWILDVGSGEGFHRPLPLLTGEYRQGEFTYRVRPSDTGPGVWRIDYDPRESCAGVDFSETPAEPGVFAEHFRTQADNEMAIFFRYGWVKRHDEGGFDELIGCLRSRVDHTGRHSVELTEEGEFLDELTGVLGLTLADLDAAGRTALWERTRDNWSVQEFLGQLPSLPARRSRRKKEVVR